MQSNKGLIEKKSVLLFSVYYNFLEGRHYVKCVSYIDFKVTANGFKEEPPKKCIGFSMHQLFLFRILLAPIFPLAYVLHYIKAALINYVIYQNHLRLFANLGTA